MVRKFAQLQEQNLAGAGAGIGDTTLILKSFKLIDGTDITDMSAVFGSKAYGTIEPGKGTREEQISFTGITTNGDGTVSLTGVSSVLMVDPYTETAGLTKQHAGGVSFVISNTSGFYSEFIVAGDDYDITGEFTFKTQPKVDVDVDVDGNPDDPVDPEDIPTKYYVDKKVDEVSDSLSDYLAKTGGTMEGGIDMDGNEITGLPLPTSSDLDQPANVEYVNNVAIAGAPDASETVKGLVEIATDAQIESQTDIGETGAPLVVPPSKVPGVEWKASKTYNENDPVWYGNRFFKSTADSNLNKEPGVDTYQTPYELANPVQSDSGTVTVKPQGTFANNGTYFFYRETTSQIKRKTLSTAYDISTETTEDTYTLPNGINLHATIGGLRMKPDGTVLYILADGGSYDAIYQFSTASAYDFSSATYDGVGYVANNDNIVVEFDFNEDGTKVYLSMTSYDAIYEKDTTSAWNVVGMSVSLGTSVFYVANMTPRNFRFVDSGNKMFICGLGANAFGTRIYDLSTAYDPSSAGDYVQLPSQYHVNYVMDISDDGNYLYITDNSTAFNFYELKKQWWEKTIRFGSIETLDYDYGNNTLAISEVISGEGMAFGWIQSTGANVNLTFNGISLATSASSDSDTLNFCFPVSEGDVVEITSSDGNGALYFRPIG